jgi:hypothetical protein
MPSLHMSRIALGGQGGVTEEQALLEGPRDVQAEEQALGGQDVQAEEQALEDQGGGDEQLSLENQGLQGGVQPDDLGEYELLDAEKDLDPLGEWWEGAQQEQEQGETQAVDQGGEQAEQEGDQGMQEDAGLTQVESNLQEKDEGEGQGEGDIVGQVGLGGEGQLVGEGEEDQRGEQTGGLPAAPVDMSTQLASMKLGKIYLPSAEYFLSLDGFCFSRLRSATS